MWASFLSNLNGWATYRFGSQFCSPSTSLEGFNVKTIIPRRRAGVDVFMHCRPEGYVSVTDVAKSSHRTPNTPHLRILSLSDSSHTSLPLPTLALGSITRSAIHHSLLALKTQLRLRMDVAAWTRMDSHRQRTRGSTCERILLPQVEVCVACMCSFTGAHTHAVALCKVLGDEWQ